MSDTAVATTKSASSRLHLIDLLRLVATLQMVNGHTLDAVVAPENLQGPGFANYQFFRGLVSVSFMLASGVAFHLTTIARIGSGALDRSATIKRVRRMIEIIVLGYLLRLPLGALTDDADLARRSWNRFAEIDVLQLIGVTLLVLELVAHVLKDRRRTEIATGVVAVVVVALAPITEGVVAERPLGYLTAWLGHQTGSFFPLFPWSAYVCAGVLLGAIAFPQGGRTPTRHTFFALAGLAAVGTAFTYGLWRVPFSLWHEPMSYHSMPAFFVEKLTWVLGILTVLSPFVGRIRNLWWPIAELAQETLPMYVFHLLALFFPPMTFAARIGHDLTLAQGLGCSAAMVALSCTVGLLWPRLSPIARRRAPKKARASAVPAAPTA